jgi:hypothetical protein
MARYPFGANVTRVFEPEQWSFIVSAPKRPAGHLLERDRVGTPVGPSQVKVPCEKHPIAGDHHRPLLRNHRLSRFKPSTQGRLPLGLAPVSPSGDV